MSLCKGFCGMGANEVSHDLSNYPYFSWCGFLDLCKSKQGTANGYDMVQYVFKVTSVGVKMDIYKI
jgi:hypothetical protein